VAVLLVGIDEAGYGPMLGPLCVGACAVRVEGWRPGDEAPDLWACLAPGVCRRPGDPRGRVAIEDSKKLKLPNDARRHPLTHLERGVLAAWRAIDPERPIPSTDIGLLAALGVPLERRTGSPTADAGAESSAWYLGEALPAPVAHDAGSIEIAGNILAGACDRAGVRVVDLRCRAVFEEEFNRTVRHHRSKAATTLIGIGEHLRRIWVEWSAVDPAQPQNHPRVVIDRLGGRTGYAQLLADLLGPEVAPSIAVREMPGAPGVSRALIEGHGADGQSRRRLSVLVRPEAESACLPVALASMTAKYCRELLMARFNRCWSQAAARAGLGELKPTAGYVQDARRWLEEAAPLLEPGVREAMVRLA
jgi:hypothetical protein